MYVTGMLLGLQPYFKAKTSLKVALSRAKPYVLIGRVASQAAAPFFLDKDSSSVLC